ncbi:MAG: ATP-binding cassette domain-containing protein [Candidatus Dormibacteraeota bacterium]|jgi:ABC-type lipoprotein export system ATPase subunit|nr:ATP-binding cassette domain-containing protein [Candidatus Dormibacteraeota bacterium]
MTSAQGQATSRGLEIHFDGVVHLYPSPEGDVVALRGVDLDVEEGEEFALLGPSGSGKSTVLALLAGLQRPSAGRITIGPYEMGKLTNRQLLRLRATEVSLVLQDPARNLLPYATATQNIEFSQRGAKGRGHRPPWQPPELLRHLGMGQLADRTIATLSGGEQQRVAIASGVASAPRLLLVDEPTSQLDTKSRDQVIDLLHQINQQLGSTVVSVTHDAAVAAAMPRTVTIRDGRVGAEGRRGEEYAVVGKDGSVQLPPDVLEMLPPGTLLHVRRHGSGVDLRNPELEHGKESIGDL